MTHRKPVAKVCDPTQALPAGHRVLISFLIKSSSAVEDAWACCTSKALRDSVTRCRGPVHSASLKDASRVNADRVGNVATRSNSAKFYKSPKFLYLLAELCLQAKPSQLSGFTIHDQRTSESHMKMNRWFFMFFFYSLKPPKLQPKESQNPASFDPRKLIANRIRHAPPT